MALAAGAAPVELIPTFCALAAHGIANSEVIKSVLMGVRIVM